MNNSALKDIQQSLNIIRTEIEQVDAETKMAALELIMSRIVMVQTLGLSIRS